MAKTTQSQMIQYAVVLLRAGTLLSELPKALIDEYSITRPRARMIAGLALERMTGLAMDEGKKNEKIPKIEWASLSVDRTKRGLQAVYKSLMKTSEEGDSFDFEKALNQEFTTDESVFLSRIIRGKFNVLSASDFTRDFYDIIDWLDKRFGLNKELSGE